MMKMDVQSSRRMLEAKRAELMSVYRETQGIAIQRVPDSLEELNLEFQRNMAVDFLNRRAALLCQVSEALERIAEGDYGVCQACQKAISSKRLAALPWAALCLECQEAEENSLGIDAQASVRIGYGASNEGKQLSTKLPRRPAIPGASTSVRTANSQARL